MASVTALLQKPWAAGCILWQICWCASWNCLSLQLHNATTASLSRASFHVWRAYEPISTTVILKICCWKSAHEFDTALCERRDLPQFRSCLPVNYASIVYSWMPFNWLPMLGRNVFRRKTINMGMSVNVGWCVCVCGYLHAISISIALLGQLHTTFIFEFYEI